MRYRVSVPAREVRPRRNPAPRLGPASVRPPCLFCPPNIAPRRIPQPDSLSALTVNSPRNVLGPLAGRPLAGGGAGRWTGHRGGLAAGWREGGQAATSQGKAGTAPPSSRLPLPGRALHGTALAAATRRDGIINQLEPEGKEKGETGP